MVGVGLMVQVRSAQRIEIPILKALLELVKSYVEDDTYDYVRLFRNGLKRFGPYELSSMFYN